MFGRAGRFTRFTNRETSECSNTGRRRPAGGSPSATPVCKTYQIRRAVTWLYWTIFFSFLAGLFSSRISFAADSEITAVKDSQTISARGILRVAITRFDLPAFHWRDLKGRYVGPEIELTRLIGRSLKTGVEFVDDCPTFESVIDAVASGHADIGVSTLSQTPSGILRVRFSEPYLVLRQAALFNRATIANLAEGGAPETVIRRFGGTIGVIAESAYVGFARSNFPDARVSELLTWQDAIEALRLERVDMVYHDEFEVRRILKLDPSMNVSFGSAGFSDQKSLLSIAICQSCARLQALINYQIAERSVPFILSKMLSIGGNN